MYRHILNTRPGTRIGRGARFASNETSDPEQFEDGESNLRPLCIEDILSDSVTESSPTDVSYGDLILPMQSGNSFSEESSSNDTLEALRRTIPQPLNRSSRANASSIDSSKTEITTKLKSVTDSSVETKPSAKFPFEDSTNEDINTFIQLQNKLRIFETTRRESFITCVTDFLNDAKTTPNLVKEAVEYTLQKCIEKPFWSELLASHTNVFVLHKTYGQQFKNAVMEGLQKYFEGRTLMYENYPKKFSNCVILLGEFYMRYRLKSMERFKIFSEPLCELLLMLIKSSSEENYKIIAQQIRCNGYALKTTFCGDRYESLLLEIRLKLLETTNDSERLWMLLCLDLAYCQGILPEEVRKIYANTLGSNIFNELDPADLDVFVPSDLTEFYNLADKNINVTQIILN